MRQCVLFLGIALLMMVDAGLAGPDVDSMALDEKQTAHLTRAVNLLDNKPTGEDIQWLRAQMTPGNEPVNMLAAVVLYRSDTAAYREELFEYFTVDDYAERARGEQNFITQDKFVAAVGEIEKQVAEEFVKRNLMHLFGYWYFRDRNEWFTLNEQTISAARFFRTSTLSTFLGLSKEQALSLAARIDKAAQTAAESGK